MIVLILGIAAAFAAGKAVYDKSESIGRAIILVLLAWIGGAIASLAIGEFAGLALNYSTWGLLIGCGILWIAYPKA